MFPAKSTKYNPIQKLYVGCCNDHPKTNDPNWYCTLAPHHTGLHIAHATNNTIVAAWTSDYSMLIELWR